MKDTKAAIKTKGDRRAVANGCWFDVAAADRVCYFFETFLKHSKGQWAGHAFELQPWQRDDLLRPLFGWMHKDGTRRFRLAYIEIPKKNGKSSLCSGLSLYFCIADNEPGAEVYNAASDREQASIVYRESAAMVKASPGLSKRLKVTDSKKRIDHFDSGSFIRVISKDAYSAEGLNIHALIFDELHAQKTRELWDALRYGGAARRQPLLMSITTAGWDTSSICYEQHEYAQKVIRGEVYDDAFFPLIYAADKEDDWTKEATWKKANPSYGITISERSFSGAVKEASSSPVKENSFKRYRLNIWTEQAERWIDGAMWMKNTTCKSKQDPKEWREAKIEEMRGKACLAGLDLGSTSDLSALVLLFGGRTIIPYFWCPEGALQTKDNIHRDLYRSWIKQWFMLSTPGDVTDYSQVRRDINTLPFGIEEIAVDRLFQGAQLCTDLMDDGFDVISFGQGFVSMAAPAKEFEERVIAGRFDHGSNPILKWMASNVSVKEDDAGNKKPIKPKRNSPFKIDGIVSCIMALGREMVCGGSGSVYDSKGIRTL